MKKFNKPKFLERAFNVFYDERGYLATIDLNEIIKEIDCFNMIYKLTSFSKKKNTFRGLHFQEEPNDQEKLLFLCHGKIKDYLVNIHDYEDQYCFSMSAGDVLYIPSNYAHGFHTLTDDTFLEYFCSKPFAEKSYRSLSYKLVKGMKEYKDLIISEKDFNAHIE